MHKQKAKNIFQQKSIPLTG